MLLLKPTVQLNGKKYKVISQIGEGAFAFVYHVKSITKETKYEDYAIKKMICQTSEQLQEAKKEIDIMIKIKHINILPLVDFSYATNKKGQEEVMLLMPLYHTSVQTLIDHGYGYPYCSFHDGLDLVKVLRNCIDGLQALHLAGYRHADLKPGNLLITEHYQAVLTDFGSCQPLTTTVTNRSEALTIQENASVFTTASYRAPELCETPSSIIIDGKTDIWSFGCLMYCLMFSRTPFESLTEGLSTLSILTGSFTYPIENKEIAALWPEDYLELINKCLAVNPSQRIDLDELILKLKRLSGPPLDLKIPPELFAKSSQGGGSSEKNTASLGKTLFHRLDTKSQKSSSNNPSASSSPHMVGIGSDSFKNSASNTPYSSKSHTINKEIVGGGGESNSAATTPHDNGEEVVAIAIPSLERAFSKSLDFADFNASDLPGTDLSEELKGHIVEIKDGGVVKKIEEGGGEGEDDEEGGDDKLFGSDDEDGFDDFVLAPQETSNGGVAGNNDNESNNNHTQESEEFGEFTAIRSKSQDLNNIKPQSPLSPTSASTLEIIDLHHLIINDLATRKIVKEGIVYSMRLGGFPKKMMRKPNWLILTPNGIILRKDKEMNSKIHEIITLHRPLSVNASDTLSIGMNGIMICGSSPLPLFSGGHDSNDKEMTIIANGHSNSNHENDSKRDIWYKLSYRQTPFNSVGDTTSPIEYRTKCTNNTKLEIGCQNRDEMNEWIDVIMNQFEKALDNLIH